MLRRDAVSFGPAEAPGPTRRQHQLVSARARPCPLAGQAMVRRSLAALAAGRRGESLPEGFSFQGSDNRCGR